MPVIRQATLTVPGWPAREAPIRAVLLADIHLGGIDMTASRFSAIVDSVNRLRPDVIVIAGDFVTNWAADRQDIGVVASQIKRLHSRFGTVAVLGNHDNWNDVALLRQSLAQAGVGLVDNGAVRRGPLIIAGSGDTVSGHARLGGTLNAVRRLTRARPGAIVYLAHSPDILKWLPDGPAVLLAGHTHCGQVVLPWIGTPFPVSQIFGNELRCGLIQRGDKTIVVTAGLSTSTVPVRIGAPPDFWLLTLSGGNVAEPEIGVDADW